MPKPLSEMGQESILDPLKKDHSPYYTCTKSNSVACNSV